MKKYRLHPLFLLYIVFLLILGQFEGVIIYMLVVTLHEMGHFVVAKRLGYNLDRFLVMPFGVCLNYNTNAFLPSDEIKIAISGPLVNFFLGIFCVALWWIYPESYNYTYVFCLANFVIFAFNLLPCFPLDGGRVLAGILTKKLDRKLAIKITLIFNFGVTIVLVLTFILGLFFGVYNMNLLIISMFLFVAILEPQKSTSYNYLSLSFNNKLLKTKNQQIKFMLVLSSEKLYKVYAKMSKYKFNIFYILFPDDKIKMISEITLQKLAIKCDPKASFDEIFCD